MQTKCTMRRLLLLASALGLSAGVAAPALAQEDKERPAAQPGRSEAPPQRPEARPQRPAFIPEQAAPRPLSLPIAPPDGSRRATPRDVSGWTRAIDQRYQQEAISQRQEGTVGFRLHISTTGRVTDCVITSSSGFPLLDDAACDGLQRFARFDPAVDADGNAVEDTWSSRINFRIP